MESDYFTVSLVLRSKLGFISENKPTTTGMTTLDSSGWMHCRNFLDVQEMGSQGGGHACDLCVSTVDTFLTNSIYALVFALFLCAFAFLVFFLEHACSTINGAVD
jgi:hypothetical protein